MMVNGVEQVRLAMLALPRALDFDRAPPEGESWSQTVVTAIDGSVCASIGHVAQHVADKVTIILYTVSQKKQDTKLLPITSPNVNRFSKFFHW